jgi:hypothetical protein
MEKIASEEYQRTRPEAKIKKAKNCKHQLRKCGDISPAA